MKSSSRKKTVSKSNERQTWEKLLLAAILLLAAGLRLWGLDQNGFANTYYAAAVRSMATSLHNLLFVSFDPSGFVSVDKPPLALWIQVAFVKLFGFRPLSLLLPQALEGIASVALIYHLVRRRFDAWAALLAGLAMAIGPICVAVDRYNNVDSCLVLFLLLAAWAFSVATEKASRAYLLLAAGLVGMAFNAKMLAAFVVLPTFFAIYLLGAKLSWRKKMLDLTLASVVLAVVSLSWVLFVDLTPPGKRPYVGSTNDDSMMSLSLGWNGFQRLLVKRRWRGEENGVGPEMAPNTTPAAIGNGQEPFARGRGRGRGLGAGNPGPLRLAEKDNAGQIAWMLPLVLLGIGFLIRKSRRKLPLSPEDQALFLWSGWLFTYAVVLSFLRGPMHIYYLVMLAPPFSALTGISARTLWLAFRDDKRDSNSFLFPIALLLTAVWQALVIFQYPTVKIPLLSILFVAIGVAGFCLLQRKRNQWQLVGVAAGAISLMAAPFFWSLTPLLELNKGVSPEAGPSLLVSNSRKQEKDEANTKRLISFIEENHQTERYWLVAQNIRPIAPVIIEAGLPAMALGGFMGRDPVLTVTTFAKMVSENQFRYVMLSRPRRQGFNGGREGSNAEIFKWVREHGKQVEVAQWRLPDSKEDKDTNPNDKRGAGGNGNLRGWDRGLSNMELYDLRPSTTLASTGSNRRSPK